VRPVRAEINLDAIRHNTAVLAAAARPAQLCAVVKADGYGHGAVPVARAALDGGAACLAVALVDEGAELRDAGIDAPIMVLSQASASEADELVDRRLQATVYTPAGVAALDAAAQRAAPRAGDKRVGLVDVHLKVDTGMRRVGTEPSAAVALASDIASRPALRLASVFTHCAVADEPGNPFTSEQLRRFDRVRADLRAAGIEVPMVHAANTAATLDHPEARFDLVRCGIGVYGLDPSPALAGRADLEPALSLHAEVSHVKRVAAGEGLSYGLRHHTQRETTIATLPLGYADGLPRRLGATGGEVLLCGRRVPIVGSVTMDQVLIDLGDQPVAVGDPVVLIGSQGGERIGAQDWADRLETISYEIVCAISQRVPRRYVSRPTT